jgi:hypothetical protein
VRAEYRNIRQSILLPAIAVITALNANAGAFPFATVSNATETSGLAVNAKATVTTGANTITIELEDLQANPLSDAQCLSKFFFTLSDTPTGAHGTITPTEIANLIRIASGGGVSVDNSVYSVYEDWTLTASGPGIYIDSLPGSPRQTIIGPGPYTTANPSVTAGPHNPYIDRIATFAFKVNGVTTSTVVSSAIFAFGTAEGDNVAGVEGSAGSVAPEPPNFLLMLAGAGLLAVGAARARPHPP